MNNTDETDLENPPLNDGHIHEAIDRIHVAIEHLHWVLHEHSLIKAVPAFQAEVASAIDILAGLYQTIGSYDHVSEIEAEVAATSPRLSRNSPSA